MAHPIAARRFLVAPRKLAVGVTLAALALLGLSIAGTAQWVRAPAGSVYYTLQVPGSGTVTFAKPPERIAGAHEQDGKMVAAEAVVSKPGLKELGIMQSSSSKNVFLFARTGGADGPVAAEWELWHVVPEVTVSGTKTTPIVTVRFLADTITAGY